VVGVVLRQASSFEGEEFFASEITEIAFDEELPDELFTFSVPPGETLRSALTDRGEWVSLEEAVRRTPFTVWAPSRVPEGFRLRVRLVPSFLADDTPGSVQLVYSPDDGAHHLSLNEVPAGTFGDADLYGDYEARWHEGLAYRVQQAGQEGLWSQTAVLAERDEVSIGLTSDLPVDTVLEIAASLVPARSDLPPLQDVPV